MTRIAELNVARPLYAADDPRFAGFVENLSRINALAERSPGFVWRFQTGSGHAMDAAYPDPDVIPNLSVWESVEHLEAYVFGTVHARFYARRDEWFPMMDTPHFVMWEVEDDHRPTLLEAAARLAEYARTGPTARVFGWERLSHQRWAEARCA